MTVRKVTVKVPATSANLGGGFDCLGMALRLYNTVEAEFCDKLTIISDVQAPADATNLIYKAMNEIFVRFGMKDAPVKIVTHSEIPQASGLGSSAACIAAGVLAANTLIGGKLQKDELVSICTSLDGHPDNVVPALTGGVTASYTDGTAVHYISAPPPDGLVIAVATPHQMLKTSAARAVLPKSYTREDCVYSLSRAAVTFGALMSGRLDILRGSVDDRLHQPYRAPLICGYEKMCEAFKKAGALSCCISGAGPSVIAFFDGEPRSVQLEDCTVRVLLPDAAGAAVNIEE